MDEETQRRLEEIHEKIREKSREGLAYEWGYDSRPGCVYWDDETETWLFAAHVEGAYNLVSCDEFPLGFELGESWGDAEYVPVEETPLHHATYGLDRAREGYGPVVSSQR